MATNGTTDLTQALRERGVRKKLAKKIGELDGDKGSGAMGEQRARQAADDLIAAASEIRSRVLTEEPKQHAAKRGAATLRAKVARVRLSNR